MQIERSDWFVRRRRLTDVQGNPSTWSSKGQPTEEIEPQRIWRERDARYALEIRIELALPVGDAEMSDVGIAHHHAS